MTQSLLTSKPSLVELAADINSEHALVIDAFRRGLHHARRAGELLIAAKERVRSEVGPRQWLSWLRANCPELSLRSMQSYMQIASGWPTLEANVQHAAHLEDLPLRRALALLADPNENDGRAGHRLQAQGWKTLHIDDIAMPDWGWRYDDPERMEKLTTNLRTRGQLHALIVRTNEDGDYELIDGRQRLACMRTLGFTEVMVRDVGPMSRDEAVQLALGNELRFKIDYAKLAYEVAGMVKAGASLASLASASPFGAERIGHFVTLAAWDWSKFKKEVQPDSDGGDTTQAEERGAAKAEREADAAMAEKYKCPRCAYEWSGNPRPWRPGGRAIADARDRKNGVRRLRLVYPAEEYRELKKALRVLAATLGTEGVEATVRAAVLHVNRLGHT